MADEPHLVEEKKTRAPRKSYRDKMIESLSERIKHLKFKLKGYSHLRKELDECVAALVALQPTSKPLEQSNNDYGGVHVPRHPEVLTATSDGALTIMKALPDEFSSDDLASHLNGDKQKAYSWIAQWKANDLIGTRLRGQYYRK